MEIAINILAIIGTLAIIWMIYWLLFKVKAFKYYLAAKLSGVDISLLEIIMMGIRSPDSSLIINSLIGLKENQIDIEKDELEVFQIAGGNLENLTNALIYAKNEHIEIKTILAMQLVMRNKNLKEDLRIWKISNPDNTTYKA